MGLESPIYVVAKGLGLLWGCKALWVGVGLESPRQDFRFLALSIGLESPMRLLVWGRQEFKA